MGKPFSMIQNGVPVSNARDLGIIQTRVQNRNVNSVPLCETVGIDTETDDGRIILLADSEGSVLEHPHISFDAVARFLLRHEGKWLFFHNLSYDSDCILRLLPESVLSEYKTRRRLDFNHVGYHVTYIDKKQLTVRRGHHAVSCYDTAQYYDGNSLSRAYGDNVGGTLPPDYLQMKVNRPDFSLRYFQRHKKALRKYCIMDCILTKALADHWLDIFYRHYGFYPGRWVSPVIWRRRSLSGTMSRCRYSAISRTRRKNSHGRHFAAEGLS
jgi:hypothetical protein